MLQLVSEFSVHILVDNLLYYHTFHNFYLNIMYYKYDLSLYLNHFYITVYISFFCLIIIPVAFFTIYILIQILRSWIFGVKLNFINFSYLTIEQVHLQFQAQVYTDYLSNNVDRNTEACSWITS